MHSFVTIAFAGLAVALPQATTTAAPMSPSAVQPPYQHSKNFTLAITNNDEAGLNGFVLQQAHEGAGSNYLVFQRPSAYQGYTSFLEGPYTDVGDGHAYLQQYLPNSATAYGVKVPQAGKPGGLDLVLGMPGDQTHGFGISSQDNTLTYDALVKDADFFACSENVPGLGEALVYKYGVVTEESGTPSDCHHVQLRASYSE